MIASSAAVSSRGGAAPAAARSKLEIGELLDRALEVRDAGAPGVGDQPVGRARGHPQLPLDLRVRFAGLERDGDLVGGADAAAHPVEEARQSLALAAQRQVQARGRVLRRRTRCASASDHALCSADGAVSSSTIAWSTRAP